MRGDGAVKVTLMKVRPEVVALQIRENIAHQKGAEQRRLQGRQPCAVMAYIMERGRRGKEGVEDALARIIHRLNIGHQPVSCEREVRDMALRATNFLQELATHAGHWCLLIDSGRKVVE